MKEIPLTQGKVALVDDKDYDRINHYNWCAWEPNRAGRFYAQSRFNYQLHLMHRFVLELIDPKIICDHLNGDGLDNRRSNLHVVSQTFNLFNRNKISRNGNRSSRFKGVFWNKSRHLWQASTSINYIRMRLGWFMIEEDAARAYDNKVIELLGEAAFTGRCLNFPNREL